MGNEQGELQEKGIQEETGFFFFFEVKRWNQKCGKAKEAGVYTAQYQEGENCVGKKFQRPVQCVLNSKHPNGKSEIDRLDKKQDLTLGSQRVRHN